MYRLPHLFTIVFATVLAGLSVRFSPVQAQEQPPQHQISPKVADDPQDVTAVDINGDGKKDALSASKDNKVAWYPNKGGQFDKQIIISNEVTVVNNVLAYDIDNDGDNDVVSGSGILTGSNKDEKLSWYENKDGSGSFSKEKIVDKGVGGVQSIATFDINNDGRKDLISLFYSEDKLVWYENKKEGSFSSGNTIDQLDSNAKSISISDINGDRSPEVLIVISNAIRSDPILAYYENTDGKGSFSGQKMIEESEDIGGTVMAEDVDNDGDNDIIVSHKLSWFENLGGTSFSEQKVISNEFAYDIDIVDIDGDGDKDIISGTSEGITAHEKVVSEEDSGKIFGDPLKISSNIERPWSIVSTDLDNDGSKDVLSVLNEKDRIAWYKNKLKANGSFSSERTIVPYSPEGARSLFARDLDDDDYMDILTVSDGDLFRFESNGGKFEDPKIIDTTGTFTSVASYDISGNGLPDIVSSKSTKIVWYEGKGNGTLTEEKTVTAEVGAREIAVSDVNQDELPDMVAIGRDGVFWFKNAGQGEWSDRIDLDDSGGRAISTFDYDNDGDKDLLAASRSEIVWYRKDENGFSDRLTVTTDVEQVESVAAADINGNGRMDALSGSVTDDKLAWYENTDGSGFSDQKIISNSEAWAIGIRDVDEDGDNDIIFSDGGIVWAKNNQSFGSLSFEEISLAADNSGAVFLNDLDGDGDSDILADGSQRIVWLENTSNTLPIEMVTFGATVRGNTASLSWKTASETENSGFDVQYRADQTSDWNEIGHVESKATGGTTSESQTYQYRAGNLSVGTHQFRLKQIDLDGRSSIHGPISVEVEMQQPIKLTPPSPNPVSNAATVSFAVKEQGEAQITLYDILGRQVGTLYRGTPNPGQSRRIEFDVNGLSSGTYFLRLEANDRTETRRVMVEK